MARTTDMGCAWCDSDQGPVCPDCRAQGADRWLRLLTPEELVAKAMGPYGGDDSTEDES